MNLLYKIAYNSAVLGIAALEVVIDIVGPPCDCAHGSEPGDTLIARKEGGHRFFRFMGVD